MANGLILCFIIIIIFCFSSPFFMVPYDSWVHIIEIKTIMLHNDHYLFFPERGFHNYLWHYFWAIIFKTFSIYDPFNMAGIIHKLQFALSFLLLNFFSRNILSIIFDNSQARNKLFIIKIVSVFAPMLFIITTGTYSVGFQQSWIMWYSVTYQISLIFYFYAFSCVCYAMHKLDQDRRRWNIAIALLFSFLILLIHPLEFIYLILALSMFLVYLFLYGAPIKVVCYFKIYKYYIIAIGVFFLIFMIIALFNNINKIQLYFNSDLLQNGVAITHDLNRKSSTLVNNYIIYFLPLSQIIINFSLKSKCELNYKFLFCLLLISAFFTIIPLNSYLAGCFSFVSPIDVYRFFYASFIFIFLVIYIADILLDVFNNHRIISMIKLVFFFLILCCSYSNIWLQNYYSVVNPSEPNLKEQNFDFVRDYLLQNHLECSSNNIYIARLDIDYLLASIGCNVYANPHENYSVTKYIDSGLKYKLYIVPQLYKTPIYVDRFKFE